MASSWSYSRSRWCRRRRRNRRRSRRGCSRRSSQAASRWKSDVGASEPCSGDFLGLTRFRGFSTANATPRQDGGGQGGEGACVMSEASGEAEASGRVRHGPQRPGGPRCLCLRLRLAGSFDHAPGAVERAFGELEAEQPVALERAGQRKLSGFRAREAEAGIVGRVTQQNDRAMATRLRRRERVVHQRSPSAKLAGGYLYRERAEHERRDAPDADVPQPHGPHQAASRRGRQGKAFGGRTSVAQALAGAAEAIVAKAGIQQRFTRNDVRATLRTDRERSGIGGEGDWGLPQSSHGTSVSTPTAGRAAERCSENS